MDIVKSAAKTLFNDDVKDLSMDVIEMGLDSMIDNDILKELPFVKTVCAVTKTSIAIRERFLIKKFVNFIKTFNDYNVDESEVTKRKIAIENNEKWIYDEIEFLITYLDNMNSIKKAKVFAALYSEYLNRKIDWERFCQLTEITDRMLSYDINRIIGFYNYCSSEDNQGLYYDLTSYSRLVGLGLMEKEVDFGSATSKLEKVLKVGSYIYRITYSGKEIGKICSTLE